MQNTRDSIMKQFIKSLLYRKYTLWLDLNVPFDNYVHSQIKTILKSIKDQQ